jgi:hypothetical protein
MSKLKKRKSTVLVGSRIDTTYERIKTVREQALELSKTDFPHLKDKPIKYDLKR